MEDLCQDAIKSRFIRCDAINLILPFRARRGEAPFCDRFTAIVLCLIVYFRAACLREGVSFGRVAHFPITCGNNVAVVLLHVSFKTICEGTMDLDLIYG